MVKNIARALGVFVFVAAWTPFLACDFLQIGGSTDNTNDNSIDNTNDNATDNTNDNADDSTANLAIFVDPDSAFSTSDVRDVDDEIVRFDTSAKTIIWAEDGTAYQEGQWEVNGVLLAGGGFQVRFGTEGGERRAYFTETGNGFICQIEAQGATISITGTNVPVPQE